jgi:hypothetical protein
MIQQPPPGKVWVCTRCRVKLDEIHANHCPANGIRVQETDTLVAVWPSEVRKIRDYETD